MGRPSEFSQEVADAICEGIADGKSLRSICNSEEMPNKSTVFRWLASNKEFSDQYERAREAQGDSFFDDIAFISDQDDLEANEKRVRIDARKWMAGKLRPKRYGDKVALVGGGPDDPPIRAQVDLSKVSDDDLGALERILGAAAVAGGGAGGDNPAEG